jgi:hypothetical protein
MKVQFASILALATIASARPVKFTRQVAGNDYPAALSTPPESSLPQELIDALNQAISAGLIPDIVPSTIVNEAPTYPGNLGSSPEVCNWSITNCIADDDVYETPDNEWALSFDDGPTSASDGLYDYLHIHHQAATHFMVSSIYLYCRN